jgi:hypothetical protein
MATLMGTRTRQVMLLLPGLALILICAGCLSGNLEYTPPQSTAPSAPNSLTVDKPLDTVWKELVPALGTRFFVINNLDKESGLVNVSYSGNPESYVDCGQIESWVDNARGKRTYNMPGASSQPYEFKGTDGNLYFSERQMRLDGRMNLILESLSPTQTRITLNTRYVVTRNLQWRRVDLTGPGSSTDSISFNSGQRAEFPRRGPTKVLACQPTGKLEADALDLVKRP